MAKPKTPATGANPQTNTMAASDATKTEINSGGGPTAAGNASAANAGEVGGNATSQPEVMGVISGTNASEESKTATVEAGNTAGLAAAFRNPRDEVLRLAHLNQLANFAELVDQGRHIRVVCFFNSQKFPEDSPPAAIKVTSAVEGFRRAGMRHSAEPQEYALDHFDPEQLEIMLGEPALTVELI